MTTKKSLKNIVGSFILAALLATNAQAALTDISTSPITIASTSLEVLPNLVFVLDDSGSMRSDFLPDWADPLLSFQYLYKNAAYNGVAYNPATYYRPPVMYTSSGSVDTTTYPSLTSINSSGWTSVKRDGYGVQSTATDNLVNNAYFYTTIAGEYCTGPQLRTCTASTVPTGSYTYEAKLRWCDTYANAHGTTANSNGHCQAAQIASTDTNIANGIQSYTFPRSPSPAGVSSIKFDGYGTVTVSLIKVGTYQIMSSSVNNTVALNSDGSSLPGLLNQIVDSINACTAAITGNCTIAGYSAVSDGISVVSISAPDSSASSLTPVVTLSSSTVTVTINGVSTLSSVTATAASFATTPGSVIKTTISSLVSSYPYPGDTVKSPNRVDCAGTTCTYAEEMTNYANWWAYYHTRMQTMKTGVSLAFSTVDDQFRVGYFSINNGSYRNPSSPGANNDYLDIATFNNAQKYAWYTKFFKAYPYGETPLRIALSNAGRMYAGKLSSLNNSTVTDPMQYSCQQNFTILSTDGYWNDQTVPKQVDGTTDIGQQDGNEVRPYYDGATQVQTLTQTNQLVKQLGRYTYTVQSATTQQYKSSSDLTQTTVTTDIYPYTVDTSTLQTSTSTLQQTQRDLQSTTTKLQSSTYALRESTFQPNTSTYPLITSNFVPQINTYQLVQSDFQPNTNTFNLNQTIFNPNTNTYLMQKKVFNPDVSTSPLNISNFKPNQNAYAVNKLDFQPQISTFALQSTTYQLQSTTTPLTKTTYGLQQSTSQLQKRVKFSNNGGDTYTDTGWQNESSSCTAGTTVAGNGDITITSCQYTGYTAYSDVAGSCTTVNQSTASPYTIATAVRCQYSTSPVVTTGQTSCTSNAQQTSSPYNPQVSCAYASAGSPVNVTSGNCTVVAQSTSSPYQAAVSCAYASGVTSTVTSCSTVSKSTASPYTITSAVDCAYQAAVVTSGSTCTVTAKQTASPYSGPAVTCAYPTTATTTTNSVSSCTVATRATATTTGTVYGTATDCSYATSPTTTSVASCTYGVASSGTTNGSVWSPYNTCTYPTSATSTSANQSSCTVTAKATATTNGTTYPTATTCAYGSAAVTSASSCTVVSQSTGTTTGTVYSGPAVACSYPTTATTTTSGVACTTVAGATATTNGTVYNPKTDCAYSTTASTVSGTSCTVNVASTTSPYNAQYNTCTYPTTATTTNNNVSTCSVVAASTGTTQGSVWNSKTNCAYSTTANSSVAGATCTAVAASTTSPYAGPYKTCTYPTTATSTSNVATCTPIAQSTANTYQTARTCTYATTATVTNGSCTYNNGTVTAGVYTGNKVTCSYPTTATSTASGVACTVAARQTSTTTGAIWSTATDCAYSTTASVASTASCTVNTGSTASPYTIVNKIACAYPTTATATNTVTSCSTAARATATTTGTIYNTAKDCAYSTTPTVVNNLDTCTSVNQQTSSPYSGPSVACAYQSAVVTTDTSCTAQTATTTPVTNGNTYTKGVSCAFTSPAVTTVSSCTPASGSSGPTNYTGPIVSCAYSAYSSPVNATGTCTPAAQSTSGTYVGPAVNCTYTTPVTTYSGTCTAAAQNNTNLTARVCTSGSFPFVVGNVAVTVPSCTPNVTNLSNTPSTGVTENVTRTCAYNAYTTAAPSLCTAIPQVSPTTNGVTYPTAVNCSTVYGAFTNAASCTESGTITPETFDGSGKIVQCRVFGLSATMPAASCTESISASPNYLVTKCTNIIDTVTPVASASCVTSSDPITFIQKSCVTNSTVSNVPLCSEQTPTFANDYRTVTCGTSGGTYNTLADVSEYFYKSDLRTPQFDNCTAPTTGNVLCSNTVPDTTYNNVPTGGADQNKAQHMVTFTLGLGASGFMQYNSSYASGGSPDYNAVRDGTTADPTNGICSWQTGSACNWPFPINNDQTGVDDLWHAGVNGRGAYFSATDPTSLSNSLATALGSVSAAKGASASATTSNPNVSATDNFVFSTQFTTSNWDGDLLRRQISPTTGVVSTTADWSAQAKLDSKSASSRLIYTFDSSYSNKLKPFTAANFSSNAYFNSPYIATSVVGLSQFLCTSPTICLSSALQTSASGAALVNYLRGDRTNEGALTDNTKYFRQRTHVLGDIVNSEAVYVGIPNYAYADAGYNAFVTAQGSRKAFVYAGSNDGMLHAFSATGSAAYEAAANLAAADLSNTTNVNAALALLATDIAAGVDGGQEQWAYVPSFAFPNMYKLADKNYASKHQYLVDATPVVGDICTSNCDNDSAAWKTILVGGLNRGGRGYYAIDITDPQNPKALWEFSDSNLGYTFGNPKIAKQADGTWVVLFASGYNNVPNDDGAGGDGQGRLYVLNANTGAFIRSIPTGVGNTSSPAGLAKIAAQVVNPAADNTVVAVYGGDLYGNVWRFDINNTVGATGYDAQLLATLTDSGGNPQPITGKPQVGYVDNNTVVFVGTGSYLAASDISNTNVQSVYAIKDPLTATTTPSTAIYSNIRSTSSGFVKQTQTNTTCPTGTSTVICEPGDLVRTSTNELVDFSVGPGWYLDLPDAGERANTDLILSLGLLGFNTNVPNVEACNLGGYSFSYSLDYRTGASVASSATGVVAVKLANQLASRPEYVRLTDGTIVQITGLSGGDLKTTQPPTPPFASVTRRTSWRELISE